MLTLCQVQGQEIHKFDSIWFCMLSTIIPFYGRQSWGLERVANSPKIPQLISASSKIQIKVAWFKVWALSYHHPILPLSETAYPDVFQVWDDKSWGSQWWEGCRKKVYIRISSSTRVTTFKSLTVNDQTLFPARVLMLWKGKWLSGELWALKEKTSLCFAHIVYIERSLSSLQSSLVAILCLSHFTSVFSDGKRRMNYPLEVIVREAESFTWGDSLS